MTDYDRSGLDLKAYQPPVGSRGHNLALLGREHPEICLLDLRWEGAGDAVPLQNGLLDGSFDPFEVRKHLFERPSDVADKSFGRVVEERLQLKAHGHVAYQETVLGNGIEAAALTRV